MKKLLYGSTALVAAGLLSGAAAAEEGITGSLSGWWTAQFAIVDQDDSTGGPAANIRDHEFQRFGTITLSGDTTLDNGLQVGVSFDWNTETHEDEISRDGYVWMEFGGFRLELGSRQGAPNLMGYAAPTPSMFAWGFNSPVFTNVTVPGENQAGGPGERIAVSGTNEKLTLFTPRFGGFQLGASYTPDGTKDPAGGIFSGPPDDNTAEQQSEVFEIGANFVQSFDDLDLNLSAGWAEGDLEANNAAMNLEDRTDWTLGVSISWMSWTFGAGYKDSDQGQDLSNSGRVDWNAGIRYVTGPWGVGVQYQETESELATATANAHFDDGEMVGPILGVATGEDDATRFELAGQYEVGPGIAFQLGVQYVEYEADRTTAAATTANQNESTAIYLGTSIFF
jgi:predicted porin